MINTVITTKNWRDVANAAIMSKDITPIGRSWLHSLLGGPAVIGAQESDIIAKICRARLEEELENKIVDLTKHTLPDKPVA